MKKFNRKSNVLTAEDKKNIEALTYELLIHNWKILTSRLRDKRWKSWKAWNTNAIKYISKLINSHQDNPSNKPSDVSKTWYSDSVKKLEEMKAKKKAEKKAKKKSA